MKPSPSIGFCFSSPSFSCVPSFFFQITHFQQRKVNDGKKRNPFDFFFLLKTDPNEGKSSVVGLRSVPDDMETKREATTSTTTTTTTTTTTATATTARAKKNPATWPAVFPLAVVRRSRLLLPLATVAPILFF